jgi:hypothetical protein
MRPTALVLFLVAPIWVLRAQDTAATRRALTNGSRLAVPGGLPATLAAVRSFLRDVDSRR